MDVVVVQSGEQGASGSLKDGFPRARAQIRAQFKDLSRAQSNVDIRAALDFRADDE